ncbi:MAG: bifunctional phosphoribosylaminoimidazolecarboxamide formyltransferase/IMP cyclohydrolase [Planctomycetes bacterium]|nr:bifunctional phosphoribosylaminoimidazolecarboxamide formyltransferase/IMP cyclohydrolase [Planctomycetota bacterium]
MSTDTVRVRRALLSAFHKEGVVEFATALAARGVEILSTGGTAKAIRAAGVAVRDVSDLTGFPEMLSGRVKTLHPRVHGGLLFVRSDPAHVSEAAAHNIVPIDLILVDLYPFAEVAAKPGAQAHEVIEMIDIGGPAMIRSASKNHESVVVLTDVADLAATLAELEAHDGGSTLGFRRRMAAKALRCTASYDALIAHWLGAERFPERMVLPLELRATARYGENPHQAGAIYTLPASMAGAEAHVASAQQLSGKELSYNNFLDASAAFEAVRALPVPAAVIIKHRNPCGASMGTDLLSAWRSALAGDPLSAFGGILALNTPCTLQLAREVGVPERFFEVIVAPAFEPGVMEHFHGAVKWGKNVRLLATGALDATPRVDSVLEYRSIDGGMLVQQRDVHADIEFTCVTKRAPSARELTDLKLAWALVRHVTSNAIVFVKDGALVGCGAGQMSRVDAVELAAKKAGEKARGAVMASDAFFPFADGLLAGAAAGVTAVVQPGGSVRDADVIRACDEAGIAMVLTGRRHFRH